MGRFRSAVSRLGAVLGTAALLSAAACGTAEVPVGAEPVVTQAPAGDTLRVWVDTKEDCTGEDCESGLLFSFGVVDDARCRSPEQWKEAAHALCARHAATLSEVEVPAEAECGDGLARFARVTCEGELAPHAAPDAYSYTGILGGADQCRTHAGWAQLAAEFCDVHHVATQVSPVGECGRDQTRYARVTCGLPLRQSPPPAACTLKSIAGVCALPEHWSLLAERHCAETGQAVGEVAVAPGRTCGTGGFDFSWVTCCGPQTPPEPREGCFGLGVGGPPTACQFAEHWREVAQGVCDDAGATLHSAIPLSPCGNDTFSYTSVTCCR